MEKEKEIETNVLAVFKRAWYGKIYVCECTQILSAPPFVVCKDATGVVAMILEKDFSQALKVTK